MSIHTDRSSLVICKHVDRQTQCILDKSQRTWLNGQSVACGALPPFLSTDDGNDVRHLRDHRRLHFRAYSAKFAPDCEYRLADEPLKGGERGMELAM